MPHTLVTGANGFVASHVVNALIADGHRVTGSLRDKKKGAGILKLHPEWEGKLDFVSVADYAKEGVWDDIFEQGDFDFVVHVAAPVLDNPQNTDFERDFEIPSVRGNTELLKSASKYGKSLKTISVTGSINAITTGDPKDLASRTLTSEAWNFITKEEAIQAQDAYISYCAGKKLAEQAIWDYVQREHPSYSVNVILPPLIFGAPIQDVKTLKNMNFSTDLFYSLINGTNEVVPPTPVAAYIDVRDLAAAHVASLTSPEARNKRYVVGKPISFRAIVDILRGLPELEGRLPKDSTEEPTYPTLDVEPARTALHVEYRSAEDTFGDMAKKILAWEEELGKES